MHFRTNHELLWTICQDLARPHGHRDLRPSGKDVTDTDAPDAPPRRFSITYLTDQWEWDADLSAGTTEQAMAAAREALVVMVREETPSLACVTLLDGGVKIGVWDWVEKQPYWTWF